jgi:quinol monooxygenase YgiN
MADDIRAVNRYSIPSGKADEVKTLLLELIKKVRSEDLGTLSYEWYINDAETEMYLVARWRDSDALIAHEALFAKHPIVEQFHEKAPANRSEVFGDVSDELVKVLPSVKKLSFKHWNGFTR